MREIDGCIDVGFREKLFEFAARIDVDAERFFKEYCFVLNRRGIGVFFARGRRAGKIDEICCGNRPITAVLIAIAFS